MRVLMLALAGAAGLGAASAQAGDVLIRGARVYTVTAETPLENTDVAIHDGVIAAVGRNLPAPAPAGAAIVRAANHPLTPGLFGGLSQVGVMEVAAESQTMDASLDTGAPQWQQQWRPEFDLTLAYNPRSTAVPITRIEGVTWTVLAPFSDTVIIGQGAAVTLDGRYDAVLGGSRALFVQLGGSASALSGGSRAAQYMLLDQAIREARATTTAGVGALLHPAGREALRRYLDGGRIVFAVERAADIRRLIEFVRGFGIKPIVSGGSEAWVVAAELARADIPVILNPLANLPYSFDQLGARLDGAALLHRAGVRIAFSGDYARNIRQLAGNAVAHGLPWDVALAGITATPAEIFGLGATRGRIAVGQVADLVLWDGDPLEVTTIAQQVWIAGRAVEMRSRQTKLRERYLH